MKNVAYWWAFFWAQIIALASLVYLGVVGDVWRADASYLSAVIVLMWFIGSVDVGWKTHKLNKGIDIPTRTGWFLADAVTAFGMIGTLVGFIIMVDSSTIALGSDITNEGLKQMLGQLTAGLKTAVMTTLIGLISMVSLKFQLNNNDLLRDAKDTEQEAQFAVLLNEGS